MRRDMRLVLAILQHLEARRDIGPLDDLSIDGYESSDIAYHLRRMYEADLLDAEVIYSTTTSNRIVRVIPFGISWTGHEFLESLRVPGVLQKVRGRIGTELSNVPFAVIRDLAMTLAKQTIGLPE